MNAGILIAFMKRLVKDAAGKKVFLILDNLKVHHARPVRACLAEHVDEIAVFYLPSYSPQLNPDERLNADLKAVVTRKAPARAKGELKQAAIRHLRRLQKSPQRMMLLSTWPRPLCSMNQVHSFRINIRVVHQHPYGVVLLRTEGVSRQVPPSRLPDLPGVDAEDAHVAGEGLAHQPAGVTVVAPGNLAGLPDRGGGASNEKGGDESRPQDSAQPGAKAVKRIGTGHKNLNRFARHSLLSRIPPSYDPPHSYKKGMNCVLCS